MVRVPGGRVTIGIDEKDYREFLQDTVYARKGTKEWRERAWSGEISAAIPAHEVVLAALWLGKYEVTNAQWDLFLQLAGRVVVTIPPSDAPGPRTLEEVSRLPGHCAWVVLGGGKREAVPAVDVDTLYDLNEKTLNPEGRVPKEQWARRPLPAGTQVVTYRYSIPKAWTVKGKRLDRCPPGLEDHPVASVSRLDAEAFCRWAGYHLPTEEEWEAGARGPGGEMFPEGKQFDPLAHAWGGFNAALAKAQDAATKELDRANANLAKEKAALAKAEASGKAEAVEAAKAAVEKAQSRVDGLQKIRKLVPLPDGFLSQPVGSFPRGASACGAMDMVGNLDELTSSRLTGYPGTKSECPWLGSEACVTRGGNTIDMDIVLQAKFRKFMDYMGNLFLPHSRYESLGFRTARYDAPGASASVPAVLLARENRYLPGWAGKDFRPEFLDLVLGGAAGVEQLHESPAGSEPPGKVFVLGPARGLCLVPISGTFHGSADQFRGAAENPGDWKDPRKVPLVGLLHLSDTMALKGDVKQVRVEETLLTPVAAPGPPGPKEAGKDDGKGGKKKEGGKKPADKPGGKSGDKPADKPKGKPKDKPADKPPDKPADKPPEKPGDKPADKPPEDTPPADPPPDGDPPADGGAGGKDGGKEGGKPAEPVAPAVKRETITEFVPGTLRGLDHVDRRGGLLLGLYDYKGEKRAALWALGTGTKGGTAAGGNGLLDFPVFLLPKNSMEVARSPKPFPSTAALDPVAGTIDLKVFIPMEGKRETQEGFAVTVKLALADFEPGPPDRPWLTGGAPDKRK